MGTLCFMFSRVRIPYMFINQYRFIESIYSPDSNTLKFFVSYHIYYLTNMQTTIHYTFHPQQSFIILESQDAYLLGRPTEGKQDPKIMSCFGVQIAHRILFILIVNYVNWNISPPMDSKVFHWSEWFRSRTNEGQRLKTLPGRHRYLM